MTRQRTTYNRLHDALTALALLDGDRMTKPEDNRYQLLTSWGAGLATALGDDQLAIALATASITCHSCKDPTP